jgi:hypothetical protein
MSNCGRHHAVLIEWRNPHVFQEYPFQSPKTFRVPTNPRRVPTNPRRVPDYPMNGAVIFPQKVRSRRILTHWKKGLLLPQKKPSRYSKPGMRSTRFIRTCVVRIELL